MQTRLEPLLIKLSRIDSYPKNAEFKTGYIGLAFSILSLFTLIYFIRRKEKNMYFNPFIITALIGLVLSLGPFLHINRQTIHHPFPIPLPYALFYYIAPGFQGFRNSARWEMLFVLCMAVAIAILLNRLLKNLLLGNEMLCMYFS
jgi:hypothetical protein